MATASWQLQWRMRVHSRKPPIVGTASFFRMAWWAGLDSNRHRRCYEQRALTIELPARWAISIPRERRERLIGRSTSPIAVEEGRRLVALLPGHTGAEFAGLQTIAIA